jgi:hypothetical protein
MVRVKMDHIAHTATLLGEMRAFHNTMDPISQDSVQAIRYPVGFVDPLTGTLDARQPIYNAPELIRWIENRRTYPHSRAPVDVAHLFDEIDAVRWADLRRLRYMNGEACRATTTARPRACWKTRRRECGRHRPLRTSEP